MISSLSNARYSGLGVDARKLFKRAASAYPYRSMAQAGIQARKMSAAQLQAMAASELMYFFDAPLAHVVHYEEHLRATRQEQDRRRFARLHTRRRRP